MKKFCFFFLLLGCTAEDFPAPVAYKGDMDCVQHTRKYSNKINGSPLSTNLWIKAGFNKEFEPLPKGTPIFVTGVELTPNNPDFVKSIVAYHDGKPILWGPPAEFDGSVDVSGADHIYGRAVVKRPRTDTDISIKIDMCEAKLNQ